MATITVTYKGTVKPAKTEYLDAEEMDIQCELDLEIEDADKANEKTIRQEFDKLMAVQVKTQTDALDTWLKEKSAAIGKMAALVDRLQREPPVGSAAAAEFEKLSSDLKRIARSNDLDGGLDELKAEYAKIVDSWAKNLQAQQPLVVAEQAVKKAAIKNWNAKKARVRGFKIAKAVLMVSVLALGVVACVASLGTLTPVVAGLTISLTAISGAVSLARTGLDVKSCWNMEKRLLDQVEEEMKELAQSLGAAQKISGGFAKHATDLRNYLRGREDQVRRLTMDLKKAEAEFNGIFTDLAKLDTLDPTGGWKSEIARRKKSASDCLKRIDEITRSLNDAKKAADYANALFDWMEALGVNVARVTAVAPATMTTNLKQYVKSVEGVLDITELLTGVGAAAVGLGSPA